MVSKNGAHPLCVPSVGDVDIFPNHGGYLIVGNGLTHFKHIEGASVNERVGVEHGADDEGGPEEDSHLS